MPFEQRATFHPGLAAEGMSKVADDIRAAIEEQKKIQMTGQFNDVTMKAALDSGEITLDDWNKYQKMGWTQKQGFANGVHANMMMKMAQEKADQENALRLAHIGLYNAQARAIGAPGESTPPVVQMEDPVTKRKFSVYRSGNHWVQVPGQDLDIQQQLIKDREAAKQRQLTLEEKSRMNRELLDTEASIQGHIAQAKALEETNKAAGKAGQLYPMGADLNAQIAKAQELRSRMGLKAKKYLPNQPEPDPSTPPPADTTYAGPKTSAVKMRSPTGQVSFVPPDQVEHYKEKGAVVVE